MSEEKFSFSRIGSYENCPYGYYLTYVEKDRGRNNVYGQLGGTLHSIMEELETSLIDNVAAIEKWESEIEYLDTMDELNFPTVKSKDNYIEDVSLYLKSFKPIKFENKEVRSEEYFELQLENHVFRGYIDLLVIDHSKKEIEIYDYKTSSKSGFSGSKLIKKCYQLILYAMAMENVYPEYKITNTCFDMVKYAKHSKTGKVLERKDIMPYDEDEYERYFLTIPYDEENKNKFLNHIKESIELIKQSKENSKWVANNKNTFFCKWLCSHGDCCKYIK